MLADDATFVHRENHVTQVLNLVELSRGKHYCQSRVSGLTKERVNGRSTANINSARRFVYDENPVSIVF
jgi:hypothetical protein